MRITKLIAAVVGIGMIVVSVALSVGGLAAVAFPDGEGWVSSGPVRFQTDSAALLSDDIEIDWGPGFRRGHTFVSWGEIPAEFEIESNSNKEVFVGIATRDDARAYLDGVAVARIASFDDEHDILLVPGEYQATAPTETDIWVASSTDGTLEWDIQSGDWAIVAVNADGSPGIDVGVTAAAKVPFLRPIGAVMIVFGIGGMIGGGFLTYYGVRREKASPSTPAAPPTTQTDPVRAT